MGLCSSLPMVLPWPFGLVSSACCRPKFVPFWPTVSQGFKWLCPGCSLLKGVTDLDSSQRWPFSPFGHLPVVYPLCAIKFWACEGCPYEFFGCQNGYCSVMPSELAFRMCIIDIPQTVPIVECIYLRYKRKEIEDRHSQRFYNYVGDFILLSNNALAATSKQ